MPTESYTPLDIVLLQTGADARLDSPAVFEQPGLGRDGVLWLVEHGVKVIGIDADTPDRPFKDMVAASPTRGTRGRWRRRSIPGCCEYQRSRQHFQSSERPAMSPTRFIHQPLSGVQCVDSARGGGSMAFDLDVAACLTLQVHVELAAAPIV
ncbi:MAG: cyclase family protein [Planctomycetota bacterium]|nr:cyclase family protein [Planctomycetota bacterium]